MVTNKGAVQSKITWRHRLASYRMDHKRVAKESGRRLLQSPFTTLMAWLVIAIALSLPTGMTLVVDNLTDLGEHLDGGTSASLFLDPRIDRARALELAQQIRQRSNVAAVDYISQDQALKEFEAVSGFSDVLQLLDENPLPSVLVVTPLHSNMGSAEAQRFIDDLASTPGVTRTQLDMQWVQRLQHILSLLDSATQVIAMLLGLGVILVVGNTIRMTIEQRRDEIVVAKLVGATDSFVQRPFLYVGLWYGIGGGVLACIIVWSASLWLAGPIEALADAYQASFYVQSLSFLQAISVCIIGAIIGLLGSGLAVFKHLRDIEPT
jgi:cell division transport system permease protein